MTPINILIAEDEVIVAENLAALLRKHGYTSIMLAESGEEALEVLEKQAPDLALLDIQLSGTMDGIQLAEKINQNKAIPLIYLTALSDDSVIERAKHTHPSAYMLKPFDERELLIAIELAIANFSSKEQGETTPKVTADAAEENRTEEKEHYLLKDRIFIKKQDCFEKIALADILYIQADRSYINIVTTKQSHCISVNLHSFEQQIKYPELIRIHRSYIVNINHIDSFEHSRLFIRKQEIPIGRSYRETLAKHFHFIRTH